MKQSEHAKSEQAQPFLKQCVVLSEAAMNLLQQILGSRADAVEASPEQQVSASSSIDLDLAAVEDDFDPELLSVVAATVAPLVPQQLMNVDRLMADLEIALPQSEPAVAPLESSIFISDFTTLVPEVAPTATDIESESLMASTLETPQVPVATEDVEIVIDTEPELALNEDELAHENSRLVHRAAALHAHVVPAQPAQPTHGGPATRAIPASSSRSREIASASNIETVAPTPTYAMAQEPVLVLAENLGRAAAPMSVNHVSDAPQSEPTPAPTEQIVTVLEPLRNEPNGTYELLIELQPEELGRVEIRVEMRDGVMHAHLRAEQPGAAQTIRDAVAQLRDHLTAIGVQTGAINVDAGGTGRRHEHHDPAAEQNHHREDRADRDNSRSNRRTRATAPTDPERIDTRA